MDNSKLPQNAREEQQALEWLEEIGIGFTKSAPPKRVPATSSDRPNSRKDAA